MGYLTIPLRLNFTTHIFHGSMVPKLLLQKMMVFTWSTFVYTQVIINHLVISMYLVLVNFISNITLYQVMTHLPITQSFISSHLLSIFYLFRMEVQCCVTLPKYSTTVSNK